MIPNLLQEKDQTAEDLVQQVWALNRECIRLEVENCRLREGVRSSAGLLPLVLGLLFSALCLEAVVVGVESEHVLHGVAAAFMFLSSFLGYRGAKR
jgi:hypothetical protein